MKRLALSLMIVSIQREIVVLLILKLSKICRCDAMNDYDKINLYYNTFKKYMKEIEPPFRSSILKSVESKIDICSILNEKENESNETQKIGLEQPIVTATSKKSKRARDEMSRNEECIKKLKRRKQPQKWISWKNKIKYT